MFKAVIILCVVFFYIAVPGRIYALTDLTMIDIRIDNGYIDPGVLSVAAQGIFALIFGFISLWIFRPWNYFKSKLTRSRNNKKHVTDNVVDSEESTTRG